ncbi:hypothetical protein SEPCBS57363_005664 [Sporothrix epigloea]|uniref:Uncharacterized protein n=1 Tax=Sporothrix epigloea TaxID=1892477 RepID=A0ABP0E0Q7_9PEZI
MAAWPPPGVSAKYDDDGKGYAIDGERHLLGDYGDLAAIERRESLEKDFLENYKKTMIAEREAAIRSAESVAHPIPPKVHMMVRSLSSADRARLLSRGNVQVKVLVDPSRLTQSQRYDYLRWPRPDIVERRIRAATRPTGSELSTPAELFAKALRKGTSSLTPVEFQLLAHNFSLYGSEFQEQETEADADETWRFSIFESTAMPGNREAHNAVMKEEGIDLHLVASVLGPTLASHRFIDFASLRHSIPLSWLPLEQTPTKPQSQSQPVGQPHPTELEVAGSLESSSSQTECEVDDSKNGPANSHGAVIEDAEAEVLPGPAEASGVLCSISNALMKSMRAHTSKWEKRDKKSFEVTFHSIITSLCGFADRFTWSLPPNPYNVPEETLNQLIPPPPRLQLSPNPFGLHMSHDGRSIVRANRFSNELPVSGMQTPPWSAWSTTIPHRLVQPCQVNVSVEAYVVAIQEWTEKEEQAWNQHRAAQEAAQQKGQQQPEAPPFFSTPPFWPMTGLRIRPFNLFYESVSDSEAAKSWPGGKVLYAKSSWEALAEDEKAVYKSQCEDRRRQAWVDSLTISI